MITQEDIISCRIEDWELRMCKHFASCLELAGHSNIYSNHQERIEHLSENQLTGQIGELLGVKLLTGGYEEYLASQIVSLSDLSKGDGGSDILHSNLDIKASKWKRKNVPLLNHNLIVQEDERHEGWVYIQVMVDYESPVTGHILGWARDSELPASGNDDRFPGASALIARKLNPLPPLRWFK